MLSIKALNLRITLLPHDRNAVTDRDPWKNGFEWETRSMKKWRLSTSSERVKFPEEKHNQMSGIHFHEAIYLLEWKVWILRTEETPPLKEDLLLLKKGESSCWEVKSLNLEETCIKRSDRFPKDQRHWKAKEESRWLQRDLAKFTRWAIKYLATDKHRGVLTLHTQEGIHFFKQKWFWLQTWLLSARTSSDSVCKVWGGRKAGIIATGSRGILSFCPTIGFWWLVVDWLL